MIVSENWNDEFNSLSGRASGIVEMLGNICNTFFARRALRIVEIIFYTASTYLVEVTTNLGNIKNYVVFTLQTEGSYNRNGDDKRRSRVVFTLQTEGSYNLVLEN